ncbi:MAG: phosphatase PAP2 family protein [Bacteroidota bacterium]|jgi:membrane-associated phospholipid phosphatase
MKVFSEIASWVFLPLLMPVYGLLIALYVPSDQDYLLNEDCLYLINDSIKLAVLIMFVIFSAVAPGLSFLILKKRNIISTIDMEDKRERSIPMLIMLVYCLMLYFLFLQKAPGGVLPKYVYALPLSGVFVTVSYALINRWIKISLHAGGAGILAGFLFAYSWGHMEYEFWTLVFPILASGITLTARLYLKKHTPFEVYTGWSLAFTGTFFVNLFYPIA